MTQRRPTSEPPPTGDPALAAAEKVARVMDGFYVDPILGLLAPGAGDLVGALLGLYPLALAWRRGAPKALLARMLLNLGVDLAAGAIPLVGDVWDFFFRAHGRNLALLRARLHQGGVRSSRWDGLVVAGAVIFFVAALAAPFVVLGLALSGLARSGPLPR